MGMLPKFQAICRKEERNTMKDGEQKRLHLQILFKKKVFIYLFLARGRETLMHA